MTDVVAATPGPAELLAPGAAPSPDRWMRYTGPEDGTAVIEVGWWGSGEDKYVPGWIADRLAQSPHFQQVEAPAEAVDASAEAATAARVSARVRRAAADTDTDA